MERTFHMICFSWPDMIHCVNNSVQNQQIDLETKISV